METRTKGLTAKYCSTSPATLLKIVILGDGNVGKSSLMTRYVNDKFDDRCAHTVGVEFLRKEITLSNGERFLLQIWDTAGQERFRCLQRPFYRGTDICLLVFSVDNKESMENVTSWMREFQNYAEVDPSKFPFVIIGNKIDIGHERRQISENEARLFCQQLRHRNSLTGSDFNSTTAYLQSSPYPYVETSAKDRINVDEAFMTAVNYMKELKSYTHSLTSSPNIKLEAVNLKKVVKMGAKPCC